MDEVLVAFEAALHSADLSLFGEEGSTEQHLDEARSTLTNVISDLRHGLYLPQSTDHPNLAGPPPEGATTHSVASGHAGAALFDAVAAVLLDEQAPTQASPAEALTLFSLLHRQIVARQAARSAAHIGYLLERVTTAQYDERRRIARELHDEVAGHLGSAMNWFELREVYQDHRPRLARQKVEAARETVRESLVRLRAVMTGLRHRSAVESLSTSLTRDAESWGESGVKVRIVVTGDESWLPAKTAEELFLIVREAQRNALRHARSQLVVVDVQVTPRGVRAEVADEGVGFEVTESSPSGSGGMLSMRERAELLGGSVRVESKPGRGTRVLIDVPMKGELNGGDREAY